MNTLIPINDELLNALLENLKKSKMMSDPDQFIALYNSGFLNPNFEVVKDLAEQISNTFKNVKLHNRKLVVRTESEVAFDNVILLLENWKTISALKRVAIEILEENYPADTKMVFLDSKPGILQLEVFDEYGEVSDLKEYWIKDKLFSSQKDLVRNLFLAKVLNNYGENPNDKYIFIENVIDVDDSFILDIEKTVLSNTLSE